ncbi:NifU family protein [Haladaptatus sp. F3-133]|jgi:Fe-S cluster biogenesis protein NfuA|uniref:NifU family protein n=1 Tax=Halorutilus salinus TaxID=2487751 RepID=A0A9Q4C642_9EURY|nr:NifU family protein [Halorutilus salinus]MCX2819943.1 NifU family protein [Halorutilus salinus]
MTDEIQVDVTRKAEDEIRTLLKERGMDGHGVTVSVDYADGEASYALEFSASAGTDQVTVDDNDVPVYVEKESAAAVDGCTLDYVVENGRAGFSVETPSVEDSDEYDDSLEGRVHEFLDRNFPQIQGHGGKAVIEEIDKSEGRLRLSLEGSCSGCGISDSTMSAIRNKLPRSVDNVETVEIGTGGDGTAMEIESPF